MNKELIPNKLEQMVMRGSIPLQAVDLAHAQEYEQRVKKLVSQGKLQLVDPGNHWIGNDYSDKIDVKVNQDQTITIQYTSIEKKRRYDAHLLPGSKSQRYIHRIVGDELIRVIPNSWEPTIKSELPMHERSDNSGILDVRDIEAVVGKIMKRDASLYLRQLPILIKDKIRPYQFLGDERI